MMVTKINFKKGQRNHFAVLLARVVLLGGDDGMISSSDSSTEHRVLISEASCSFSLKLHVSFSVLLDELKQVF